MILRSKKKKHVYSSLTTKGNRIATVADIIKNKQDGAVVYIR